MKRVFLSILFASLFANSTVFSVLPKGDPKTTGKAIIADIPEDEYLRNSSEQGSFNNESQEEQPDSERNSRKRSHQEMDASSSQDQNDQQDQQDPPQRARTEEAPFVEERMEEEVESDHEGENGRGNGSFVSEEESQTKIIKDRIIAFLSSSHPKLKEKYERNPEGYHFSAKGITRLNTPSSSESRTGEIDLSNFGQCKNTDLTIIVYDDGNVDFFRLKNLERKKLRPSGCYILFAPKFYDKAAYERLNNLDDNEDSNKRKFEEDLLLIGIDLHGPSEEKRDLRGLSLKSAILIGSNLSNTDLTGSFLQKTDFSCANLQRVVMKRETDLSYSILMDTDLSFSFLEEVALANIQMKPGTNFYRAMLHDLTFNNTLSDQNTFFCINFERATFVNVLFCNCSMHYINMRWIEAEKLSFDATLLREIQFDNAKLNVFSILNSMFMGINVSFENATITESCFLGKVVGNFEHLPHVKFLPQNEYLPHFRESVRRNGDVVRKKNGFLWGVPYWATRYLGGWIVYVPYWFLCDQNEYYSKDNINSSIHSCNFSNTKMSKVLISNISFNGCIGLKNLASVYHSIFKNIVFDSEDYEIRKRLKEKGAKVNGEIDPAFRSFWAKSDDQNLLKVLANAVFSEIGRKAVVATAGAVAGSFTPLGPVGGAITALGVDSALRGSNK